jgi:propanediol dehydratase small subunit
LLFSSGADVQFTKGASGNPAGRPKGIKDKRHRFNEAIESMIPQVLDSVFQKAIAGDMTAAKMLLDRTLPNKRPEQERVEISHTGSIPSDAQNVLRSVLDGDVSPDVGASLLSAMTSVLKAIEVEDLAKRIEALEGKENESANA